MFGFAVSTSLVPNSTVSGLFLTSTSTTLYLNLYVPVLFVESVTSTVPTCSPKVEVSVDVFASSSILIFVPLFQVPVFSISVPFGSPVTFSLVILFLSSLTLKVGLNFAPLNTTKLAVVFKSSVNNIPSIVAEGTFASAFVTGIWISSVEWSGYVIVAPT